MGLFWTVPLAGILAVLFAAYLAWDVLRRDAGTPEMQQIADMIFEGAMAFMRRQYQTIGLISVVTAIVVALLVGYFGESFDLGWQTAVGFLTGAFCSALSGIIGMYVAVKTNVRCASGAARRGVVEAIDVGLKGGAVSGFMIVALSLLGVTAIFVAYDGLGHPELAPFTIVGFAFGASFVALFAQLGGGIFTKAADMGADLVGKVEAGIPEDDPRNAAVIADLVGDNVGDCAGRGADLFESTAAENIGAMILGVPIFAATGNVAWILFPLVVRAFGLVATGVGIMTVRGREGENPMSALNRGYYVAVVLSIIGMGICTYSMMNEGSRMWFFLCGVVGIMTSMAFVFITQYYTEGRFRPVQEIVRSARTGPATVMVSGVAVGYESTASTAIVISIALLLSYWFGDQALLPNGMAMPHAGLFGTAVATMGMLMTCAYILSLDTFGPITDNAAGIIEMSGAGEEARAVTDSLDAVGNTTKALTKGYAMASAALAAFLLFRAYLDEVTHTVIRRGGDPSFAFDVVDLAKIEVFIGGLIAVMLVFLFSSLAMRAVGNAASDIIEEVRRQFREDPGIMAGTSRPDYSRAVDITTTAGLRQMIAPGLLPVLVPPAVGIFFRVMGYNGAEAVASLLMVGTIAGIIMATFMNNGGAAWDNAKKWIEAGNMIDEATGEVVKKGSAIHAAAVAGDTVGDPFKDTAGPSLHVLVKLLATVTLVLAPLFI